MKNKIYVESFGYQKVLLLEIEGLEELFVAEFSYKKDKYYGIIDKNARLLVPFSTNQIVEVFATNDKSECCFTFNYEQGGYRSFHLSKTNDKYILKADIHGNDYTSCRLVNTINDNYWFIESITEGLAEYSLYDPYQAKILTPSFTEISFEEEEGRILAYVERDLATKYENELYVLGSICSFIDKDGRFVTPIYVPEFDLCYDGRRYNNDFNFKAFNMFSNSIKEMLEYNKKQRDQHITDTLATIFSEPYDYNNMVISKAPAKIIEFPGGSNEKK